MFPFLTIMYYATMLFDNFFNSIQSSMKNLIKNLLFKFLNSLKINMWSKGMMSAMMALFYLLFFMNYLSVNSLMFSVSSQISMIISMSLILFLTVNLMGMKNMKNFISHTIPESTPIYLSWFIFLIEMVSNFIRPMTLTVRLVANVTAGHLLMSLLYKMVILTKFTLFFMFMILTSLEIYISMIQAYIFVTLISLYYSEV